jgi:hypothetical protein
MTANSDPIKQFVQRKYTEASAKPHQRGAALELSMNQPAHVEGLNVALEWFTVHAISSHESSRIWELPDVRTVGILAAWKSKAPIGSVSQAYACARVAGRDMEIMRTGAPADKQQPVELLLDGAVVASLESTSDPASLSRRATKRDLRWTVKCRGGTQLQIVAEGWPSRWGTLSGEGIKERRIRLQLGNEAMWVPIVRLLCLPISLFLRRSHQAPPDAALEERDAIDFLITAYFQTIEFPTSFPG